MDYINADEIKKNIKCSDLEAAELTEHGFNKTDSFMVHENGMTLTCDIMTKALHQE